MEKEIKQLENEIESLKDIINMMLNSWKSKHPEDFEEPIGMKLCVGTKDLPSRTHDALKKVSEVDNG